MFLLFYIFSSFTFSQGYLSGQDPDSTINHLASGINEEICLKSLLDSKLLPNSSGIVVSPGGNLIEKSSEGLKIYSASGSITVSGIRCSQASVNQNVDSKINQLFEGFNLLNDHQKRGRISSSSPNITRIKNACRSVAIVRRHLDALSTSTNTQILDEPGSSN